MRIASTMFLAACGLLLMAGCSSHEMMDSSTGKEMTTMEKTMATMDAPSDTMMKDSMADESIMMPTQDPKAKTMQ